VLLRVAVAVFVLGGVYCGAAAFLGGHVPANARVAGIAVGGMSPDEAKVTLTRVLKAEPPLPVKLTASPRAAEIQPATAGLEIDLDATLSELTGFTVNPVELWAHLTGRTDYPLKAAVDRDKLVATVTAAARTLSSPVREGSISFTGGKATSVLSAAGTKVRVPETADAIESAWPGRADVAAVTTVTQPKVPASEITRAMKEQAVPAMSAPVTILVGSPKVATIRLQPEQYAAALSSVPDNEGRHLLKVDSGKLLAALRSHSPDIERVAVDATVRLVDGGPQVLAGSVGRQFNRASASAPFLKALTSSTRTTSVGLVRVSPKVTTAQARGWKIKEPISTFTTQFPVNPPRTTNIRIAAAALNGTLVRPGEQFSLNATLGERTPAKGYQRAPVIYGGRLVKDYGGGVSQVSTTTFNAAFFAGVRIEQYTPHSFYIARYPEGREATVSWPNVDQKWTNDTGFGILIKASATGGNLTVTFLGTKTQDIEAVKGPRRNIVKPKKIVDARSDCVPQSPTPGFDVTVSRIFRKNGAVVQTSLFNTHYIPENDVRCTNPEDS
jgi:vancomycin resistance protein YoaR